jgi:NarL family two-component system response regulator LiaR
MTEHKVRGAVRPQLTAREAAVVTCVAKGKSNAEIAKHLRVREQTVKSHVAVLLQKLHVRNRVQLAVLAACEWPGLADKEK